VRRDLPDLTRWFLATGVRIGEAIAVDWENIDLDDQPVQIDTRSSESRATAFGVFPE
jgi:integrase